MTDSSNRRLAAFWVSAALACLLSVGSAQAQTITYGYDALGRLTSVTRSDGTSVDYDYDDAGNRTSVVAEGLVEAPDAFELGADVTGATAGSYYSSAAPVLSGFASPLSITVAGGQYRIASGSWTTTAGTVSSGQAVQVRVQAPTTGGASQIATLTVGGVSDSFSVTTAIDTTPSAFNLGGPSTGASDAWVSSSTVTVAGINAAAPVSISGGQFRIDGGSWRTSATTVTVGQTIQVRVQAPAAGGASQTATLSIGGVTDTFQVTTTTDTTPNAFSLGGPASGTAGEWVSSSSITVAGINAAAPVSISGGQFRINGGTWRTSATTVTAGQTVQVQVQAPASGGASQTATLSIGGVTDTFQVTTGADTTPNAFNLGGPSTGASGVWVSSSTITVAGINAAAPVSISGGQFRIEGGTWRTSATTVTAGQTVQVQVQAPAAGGASQTATLSIGGVTDTFQVTTTTDTTPNAFNLGSPTAGASGAWVASSTVTVAGINAAAPVSISGGQFRINGGSWRTSATTVTVGQTVQVQVQAPTVGGDSQTATLSIGGLIDTFQVTAITDTTPSAYNLGGPATAEASAWGYSSTITVAGINAAAPISISGGQYRIDGGSWRPETTTLTVINGQTVRVRVQAPATGGTSQTATLSIGGVTDTFQVTAIADTTPSAFNLGGPSTGATGAWISSSTVTVAGINAAAPVSISGGQFRVNGGSWRTSATTVTEGQTVQVRVQAPATGGDSQTATLSIGGVTDTFQVTAIGSDTTPNSFDLGGPVTNSAGAWTPSNVVTISGIDAPAPVSVSNAQYRINGGAWQTAPGTITAGQTIQIQVQASYQSMMFEIGTLTVGDVSAWFTVQTPCVPPPGQIQCQLDPL